MLGRLAAMFETIAGNPTLLWVTIFIVAGFVAGVLNGFFRRRKVQPGVFRWKQMGIEIFGVTVSTMLNVIFLGAFTKYLHSLGWLTYNTAPAAWWVITLEYAAFFVLFDTWFYWWHRLMHIEPIYLIVHRWHHFSTTPTVLSTFSVTPLESFINGGFIPLFTAAPFLLGMPIHQQTAPFIGLTTVLMGVYVHSGFEFLPRWWNKSWATKWFITATFHDQHHQFFRYNYGGFTTIWDRICGTMRSKYEHDFENPRALKREEQRIRARQQAAAGATADLQAP
ncbi:sterol desaturase family protein [Caulobacter soli]|uniref:sterol desaturase family protein n=1 Tax=Caulobacter soli TaxID=2708539 RepID=UPI0013ECEFD2|nr:sterol desaturase family protein [Caulobacter soli]